MTIAVLSHVGSTVASGGSSSATTTSINTTGATTIICIISCYTGGTAITAPTDSRSNTWTSTTQIDVSPFSAPSMQIWYVDIPSTNASHTFTSPYPNNGYSQMSVIAVSGTANPSFDLQVTNNSAGGNTAQAGAVTPSQNNSLVIAAWGSDNSNSAGDAPTIDSGFTITDGVGYSASGSEGASLAYLIQTTAGSTNPTWTNSIGEFATGAINAAFKPGASAINYTRSFGATGSQSGRLVKAALAIRRLVDSNSSALVRKRIASVVRAALNGQIVSPNRRVTALRTATDPQSAALARRNSLIRPATSTEMVAVLRGKASLLGSVDAQAVAVRRGISAIRSAFVAESATFARLVSRLRSLSATTGQATGRVLLTSAARSAVDASLAALAEAKISGTQNFSKAISAIDAQVAAVLRNIPAIRSAIDAQSVAVSRAVGIARATVGTQAMSRVLSVFIIRGGADAQAASRSLLLAMVRGAVNAQNASRVLLVSIVRSAADAQHASPVVAAGLHARLLGAGFSQVLGLQKLVGIIRSLSGAQVVSRAAASAVARGIATAQTVALQRSTRLIRLAIEAQAAARILLVSIARSSVDAEIASLAAGPVRAKVLSAIDAQIAALVATFIHAGVNTGQALAALQAQVASLLKTALLARTVSAINAQVTSLRRNVAALRSAINAQAFNVVRLITAIRPVISLETISRRLTVFRKFAAISPEAAASIALLAFLRVCSALSSEVAALTRAGLHAPTALAVAIASSPRVVKLVSAARSITDAQAVSTAVSTGLHMIVASPQIAALVRLLIRGRAVAAQQAQVILVAAQRGLGLLTHIAVAAASKSSAALAKGLFRFLSVVDPSSTSSGQLYFKSIPIALRGRVVRLPEPQQFVALPPAARRIMLPIEGNDMSDYEINVPEPAFFSTLDPTDTDLFTFDWTVRGYPGDTIVFASIISVPTGVNFIGPAFISGKSVTITIGPFSSVPPLPSTYSLRCMAMFSSGRISNYSVPFEVRSL